jgi:glycosidase
MRIFDSRKTEYKSKLRAIATNEKVKFKIILPRLLSCTGACLAITKENESTVYYSMFWAGMCDNEHEYWELHFYATTPGLYWYHFELETPWGKHFIYNVGHGVGDFSSEASDFQQTVYDENFKTPDWFKGGIMYQIFPDRFYNSGEPKTNVRATREMREWGDEPYWNEKQLSNGIWNNDYFGGDLKGIEQKLPYIADLGVSCIYINPIFEANSNHRYDTADYEKIDPLLGTEKDLKSLCKTAKEKYGISIILDGVFSHTGCDSKYFNIYSNYDTVGAYNSKKSRYYPWYQFTNYPDEYSSWWGIKLLPEVDENVESYRHYMCGKNGIIQKWLKCGISGWRLDVADELSDTFLDDLRQCVKAENDQAIIIGEVWEDATTKFAYGNRRRYLLGNQLDSVMNYPFANLILNFVKYGDAQTFIDGVMGIIENYPPQVTNILMNHIGTHDTERAINRLAGENCEGHSRLWQYEHNQLSARNYRHGILMMKNASLLQFTLPGVPSIYYGDEIGMQGYKDPFNRECMCWDDNQNQDLLKWYKRLGEIRRSCSVFKDGEFTPVYCNYNTVAYKRCDDKNELLVALNIDNEAVDVYVGEEWNNSYSFFGGNVSKGTIHLPAYHHAMLIRENINNN